MEYGPQQKLEKHGLVSVKEFEKETARQMIQAADKRPDQMDDLVEQTKAARLALREAINGIGDAIELFEPASHKYMSMIRSFRMSAIAEVANIRKPLDDVRQFFIGPDREKELARLREFVELCERLEKLKSSGFLDAVADTILKLS